MNNKVKILVISVLCLSLCGCSKLEPDTGEGNSVLTVRVATPSDDVPLTKSQGSMFINESLCSTIRSIDILVFDYTTNNLEKHQRYSDAWNRTTNLPANTTLSDRNFSINVSEGMKKIIVIANSQHTVQEIFNYYSGATSTCPSLLEKEFPGVYTMYGMTASALSVSGNTAVSIALSRLVSRIAINSITSTFTNGSNVRLYLSTACGSATITPSGIESSVNEGTISGSGTSLGLSIVGSSYNNNNHLSCNIGNLTANSTYSTPIYFYGYPRASGATGKVKLYLSGQFNYSIYFYPVQFNSINPNTSYIIGNLTISKSGNLTSADLPFVYIESIPTVKGETGENICRIDKIVL